MVDISYKVLEWMKKVNMPGYEVVFKLLKLFVNIFFPIVYSIKKINNKKAKRVSEKIIVSFTTFPPRIDTVWQAAYTLLYQSIKVDHVILWLARTQFPSVEMLPRSLIRLRKFGLEIRFCDDLRPHKKYYYSMMNNPNAIVITVDDDVYYPSFLVEQLYNKHLEFPDAICCNWAHVIRCDKNNKILPYSEWDKGVSGYDKEPSHLLNQVGYEGVLYPINSLDAQCFNKELIMRLSLNTDDLWLKAMAYLKRTKVVRTKHVAYRYFGIMKAQKIALNDDNCGNNKNDEAIKNILSYFPEIIMEGNENGKN